ncbi:MAG TPA: TIGR01777 family oxidoreductase [Microbacteriaceae bacterium]|nr:TIGR01777 family oxidoreductase [Microbacteriaceae bacterium]
MKILLTGASGLIGSRLTPHLQSLGHEVVRLVRRAPRGPDEHNWAPAAHMLDAALLGDVDAVVNLSGASLARLPWTRAYREKLRQSRLAATRTVTDAMALAGNAPRILVNASAVGYYGDRPGLRLTEQAGRGSGFLADLAADWEEAARLAPAGTRVVLLRTGLVVAAGGAVKPLAFLARAGLGGPIGTGGQHWPWIGLEDEVRAIAHLVEGDLEGPVNLAGPTPATADEMLRALAARLGRPYRLRLGTGLIGGLLGDAGRELLLASQKVVPARLLADGFSFAAPTVAEALAAAFEADGPARDA